MLFRVFRDDDANEWVATSDADGISTGADTLDALYERLRTIVPDVLESRGVPTQGLAIVKGRHLANAFLKDAGLPKAL